ncbi:Fur family transcriptional regulator, ferric uptake regulator [Acidaminobacter hydrogenoformans DSM 2784]|uniref:Fur family transcriptional regulator, ferric uptake regulator n=2 Tax=Acidaminobacter TaxID=65402 RepID=A0A1G5S568_9FIRM|nr:Fur family transcriptional regulator, ferric uptake regulator [Acidaminobacter hydrogenoformans DSM 2784]
MNKRLEQKEVYDMKTNKTTDTKAMLEHCGIKLTRQRLDLLDQLVKGSGPTTAEQLFLSLREEASAISLSTVYRILDAFELKGLVEKVVSTDENKAVYELNRHEHGHHLICTSCKSRMTITGCPLAGYEEALAKSTNYKITGHRLEVYGLCPKCQSELEMPPVEITPDRTEGKVGTP